VVLAEAGRGDWVLCQITSESYGDAWAIQLDAADFAHGSLRLTSYARPGKLFTGHASLVAGLIGELVAAKFVAVRDAVVRMLQTESLRYTPARRGHRTARKPTRVQAMAMSAAIRDSPAMKPEAIGT
jgi:mRNA interferase MazF